MYEMRDMAEPEEPEIEPRSRSVSFPDHYLIPYIEMCKRSNRFTCVWSIILIGLAIYFFFATNYKIMFNYPITESRKIACVFAGVFCLVAAARCLELRFRIIQECRGGPNDNVLYEIARRDTEFADSFSGHFEMQDMPFCHGTPIEGTSQTETLEDSISRAHTIDDPCFADISRIRYYGSDRPPRHSISDGLAPNKPLLPPRGPLEISRPSYSTFDSFYEASSTEPPLLAKSTSRDDYEALETGPMLTESTFENGREAPETELLLPRSTFGNGREAPETEQLLPNSTFENGCDVDETEPLLPESMFENGCNTLENGSSLDKMS